VCALLWLCVLCVDVSVCVCMLVPRVSVWECVRHLCSSIKHFSSQWMDFQDIVLFYKFLKVSRDFMKIYR